MEMEEKLKIKVAATFSEAKSKYMVSKISKTNKQTHTHN